MARRRIEWAIQGIQEAIVRDNKYPSPFLAQARSNAIFVLQSLIKLEPEEKDLGRSALEDKIYNLLSGTIGEYNRVETTKLLAEVFKDHAVAFAEWLNKNTFTENTAHQKTLDTSALYTIFKQQNP